LWHYLIAGLSLYILDRAIRFYKGHLKKPMVISMHPLSGGVIRLELAYANGSHMESLPGQYIFLNVPAISEFQWHPFSISSSPDDTKFSWTHHIKNMGNGTWTQRLYELAVSKRDIELRVDGPYGNPGIQFEKYKVLAFFAGGIGITPIASILDYLFHLNRQQLIHEDIYLIWVVKDPSYFHWFRTLIMDIQEDNLKGKFISSPNVFHPRLFVTLSNSKTKNQDAQQVGTLLLQVDSPDNVHQIPADDGFKFTFGKPNMKDIVQEIVDSHPNQRIGAFICGPSSLTKSVSDTAFQIAATQIDVHSETFEL